MLSIVEKIKEVVYSVLPLFLITLLLSFTITPLSGDIITKFVIGTLMMIVGMPIFLLGVDISIEPMGEDVSGVFTKLNKLWIGLVGGCIIGFVVTVAEPDLHILAGQVSAVTAGKFKTTLMVILVSLGVGVLISFALLRIVKNIKLNKFMAIVYLIILILGIFSQPDFLAIAFDASGTTTGSVSVPFLLALSVSIASMTRSNEKETNDGFGMLGIGSAGAIIAVLIQGVFSGGGPVEGTLPEAEIITGNVWQIFMNSIVDHAKETVLVLLPIVMIYFILDALIIKAPRKKLKRIVIGLVYTYVGLVLFLTGVNTGFIEASSQVGYQLATLNMPWLLILFGMVFGVITIPAEPSVHILTKQIENETAGSIRATTVLFALCIGVAVAVGLSMLRIIVPGLQLWHILLPGMVIAIMLSFIAPDIFVGIAYDSGGVAAGTMTAAYILPFAQGAAEYFPGANVVLDGFGVIALVAMTPLVTLQLLGLIYKLKTRPAQNTRVSWDGEVE